MGVMFSFLSSSLSSIPLVPSSIPLLFSSFTAFSSVSSSSSLLCPHLFLLFSSFLPSFHYVFLLCLPSLSSFFEINHFFFHPPLFLLLKLTTFSSIAPFSSFEMNHFLFHLLFLFFLRELLVLCVLRELLVLCVLRELLVLYAPYDVIEDTIDCNPM